MLAIPHTNHNMKITKDFSVLLRAVQNDKEIVSSSIGEFKQSLNESSERSFSRTY